MSHFPHTLDFASFLDRLNTIEQEMAKVEQQLFRLMAGCHCHVRSPLGRERASDALSERDADSGAGRCVP